MIVAPTSRLVVAMATTCPLLLAFAPTATAQEALPEIVIATDRERSERAIESAFQSTTTLSGSELQQATAASLADLLSTTPGLAASTFAPGASRPNIRGLDDYRVRIQENGMGVQDASDFSQDHQAPIDPLVADSVEVIRGPATLRYGNQAIGGVVNATNNRIPQALVPNGFAAKLKGAASSVDRGTEGAVSLDASGENIAVHIDAFGRQAGDYSIPGGTQANSRLKSAGQAIGASYIFNEGYIGVALQHMTSLYHVPGTEDAEQNTRIDLKQTKISTKGEWRAPIDGLDAVRFSIVGSDYVHHELSVGDDGVDGIQNTIRNKEIEGRIEVDHAAVATPLGSLTGNWGIQASNRKLGTDGNLGGLLAPTNTDAFAVFGFEQLQLTDTLRWQVSGRAETISVSGQATTFPSNFLPGGDPLSESPANRKFVPLSISTGLLQSLPGDLIASVNLQRIQRAPAAPELFSRGSDDASGTFVIGNPDLKIETARGVELGLKRTKGRLRFEANVYATWYDDFIFKDVTGNRCTDTFDTCGSSGRLLQVAYRQSDALFRGAELSGQYDLTQLGSGTLGLDGQFDIVRATFKDGTNVPRIAPMRLGGGIWWRDAAWSARVGLLHAFAQNDLGNNETPTESYNLLKAQVSYTHKYANAPLYGIRDVTVGVVGDNLLNERIRNHISFKKNEVLQPGLGVRVFANVTF